MISLLYCGNRKVFGGILISLISVAKHASAPLDVHILTMSLTDVNDAFLGIAEEQCVFLEDILHGYNSESRVRLHDISNEFRARMMNSPNLSSVYTPYTLLRLFCDTLELPARIIYLDADTAALGDLLPLMKYDMRGCEFAGTLDYLGKFFINPRYINAGVLLLDIEKIRESGLFERARVFCAERKTAFPDQDALNRLVKKKRFLPRRFNEQKRVRDDTVIRHFSKTLILLPFPHSLNIKPWEPERLHKIYKCFDFDDVLEVWAQKMKEWDSRHIGGTSSETQITSDTATINAAANSKSDTKEGGL